MNEWKCAEGDFRERHGGKPEAVKGRIYGQYSFTIASGSLPAMRTGLRVQNTTIRWYFW